MPPTGVWELTKSFRFEAAHTLQRTVDAAGSRRIHGHSYRAVIAFTGTPDPATGMVVDLGLVERALADARDALDHHLLDEVPGLAPATLENLTAWIWARLLPALPGLCAVTVHRDSLDESCTYRGPPHAG